MKKFNRYQDIVISYNAQRESWYPNLGALGMVPPRPMFTTKAEATEEAKAAFERWQNRDEISVEEPVKADITLEECLDIFLAQSKARAVNEDEKYGWASYSNDTGAVSQIKKVVVG
jgi:hypothetical protein